MFDKSLNYFIFVHVLKYKKLSKTIVLLHWVDFS